MGRKTGFGRSENLTVNKMYSSHIKSTPAHEHVSLLVRFAVVTEKAQLDVLKHHRKTCYLGFKVIRNNFLCNPIIVYGSLFKRSTAVVLDTTRIIVAMVINVNSFSEELIILYVSGFFQVAGVVEWRCSCNLSPCLWSTEITSRICKSRLKQQLHCFVYFYNWVREGTVACTIRRITLYSMSLAFHVPKYSP